MPAVLAVFAHPDDIEFRAAGTLLLLGDRGWDVHYCNLSNGDLGSATLSRTVTAKTRALEAQASCRSMGFQWHPPLLSENVRGPEGKVWENESSFRWRLFLRPAPAQFYGRARMGRGRCLGALQQPKRGPQISAGVGPFLCLTDRGVTESG